MVINGKLLTNEELEYQWIAYLKTENRETEMVSRKDSYTVYCYSGLGPGRSAVASDEVSPPTEESIPELGGRAFLVPSLLHSLPTQLCCQLAKMLIVRAGY